MRGSTNGWCSQPRLQLRVDHFKSVAAKRGWITITQIAEGIGSSPANVSRLVNQTPDSRRPRQQTGQAPGPAFIAAALVAFPDKTFDDLFEVIPNPTTNRRPRRQRTAA